MDWGWFPDPWRFVRMRLGARGAAGSRSSGELSANRKTPAETAALVTDALTYADGPGEDAYLARRANLVRRHAGRQAVHGGVAARGGAAGAAGEEERTCGRLSYEWLAGLREIVIDPERAPLAYEEFRLKEYGRDRDGTWLDDIPDGNDHSIDAVRYAMMDDVLRG